MFLRTLEMQESVEDMESEYHGQAYYTLKPAVTRSRNLVPLWALDKPVDPADAKSKGKKQYYCCGYRQFFDRILLRSSPLNRCFYELIPEERPCRLYIDFEYYQSANPQLDRQTTLQAVIDELTTEFLRSNYRATLRCQVSSSNSSQGSSDKASYHIVGHVFDDDGNELLFRNNYHLGNFVRQFARSHPALFVQDKDQVSSEFVCDLGVYTKNRVFRTIYSHKRNDDRTLLPYDLETDTVDHAPPNYEAFAAHLITRPLDFGNGSVVGRLMHCMEEAPDGALMEPKSSSLRNLDAAQRGQKKPGTRLGQKRPRPETKAEMSTLQRRVAESVASEIRQARPGYAEPDPTQAVFLDLGTLILPSPDKLCIYKGVGATNDEGAQPLEHSGNHAYWLVYLWNGFYYQRCHSVKGRCGQEQRPTAFNGWNLSKKLIRLCAAQMRGADGVEAPTQPLMTQGADLPFSQLHSPQDRLIPVCLQ